MLRANMLAFGLCVMALSFDCRCQQPDAAIPGRAEQSPSRVSRADNADPASENSREVEKVMVELRTRFRNKDDGEIVQVLRSYCSSDQPANESGANWLANRFGLAKRQQKAAEEVQRLRGGVFYDYQKGSSICRPKGEPRAPEWARSLLTDHFFADVVGVALSGERVTDETLAHLRAFPSLEFVMLRCPKVDSSGLAHLVGFPHLEYLEVRETAVSQDGIEKLAHALPDDCAIDWNGQWVRHPKHTDKLERSKPENRPDPVW